LYQPHDLIVQQTGREGVAQFEQGYRGSGAENLRARLYQMFGEGMIGEEIFTALRDLAERGQLRSVDLAVHLSRHQRQTLSSEELGARNALNGIRSRLALLAQSRVSAETVLADLQVHLVDTDRRVAEKERAARENLVHDEDAARQSLDEKIEFVNSRERLASQAQALGADLSRLDDLRAQLEAKATELEAVLARGRLSEEVQT
jgi:hypothetical protein